MWWLLYKFFWKLNRALVKSWRSSCVLVHPCKKLPVLLERQLFFCASMFAQFFFLLEDQCLSRGKVHAHDIRRALSLFIGLSSPFLCFFLSGRLYFRWWQGAKFDDETTSSTLSLFSSKELCHITVQIFKGWLWLCAWGWYPFQNRTSRLVQCVELQWILTHLTTM